MNHHSSSESATASLKMTVESVEAIATDTKQAGSSTATLRNFLSQLSSPEVKAIHFIVQAGRTRSWLKESDSIESLYHNLNGIQSEERGRQIYIDFLTSKIDRLPAYIASYSKICGEQHLKPFDELGALVQEERTHSRSSGQFVGIHCEEKPD